MRCELPQDLIQMTDFVWGTLKATFWAFIQSGSQSYNERLARASQIETNKNEPPRLESPSVVPNPKSDTASSQTQDLKGLRSSKRGLVLGDDASRGPRLLESQRSPTLSGFQRPQIIKENSPFVARHETKITQVDSQSFGLSLSEKSSRDLAYFRLQKETSEAALEPGAGKVHSKEKDHLKYLIRALNFMWRDQQPRHTGSSETAKSDSDVTGTLDSAAMHALRMHLAASKANPQSTQPPSAPELELSSLSTADLKSFKNLYRALFGCTTSTPSPFKPKDAPLISIPPNHGLQRDGVPAAFSRRSAAPPDEDA